MEKRFVGAGLLSGLVAGIVAYLFARIVIEPKVSAAVEYTDGRSHAEAILGGEHGHEHEVFSRSVQENIGAGVGTVVFAICMGAFFAVGFTVAWAYLGRRRPATDPRLAAAALGLVGFVAVYAVPAFAYPPNPPGIGGADTIGARSSAYLTITVLSVVFAVAAVVAAAWLRARIGGPVSGMLAAAGYLVAVLLTIVVLPHFHEVPPPLRQGDRIIYPGFPAEVLGDYRVDTIADQAILWTVLTAVFVLLLGRLMRVRGHVDAQRPGY